MTIIQKIEYYTKNVEKWYNFYGKFTFINRSKGKKDLLIVLAGYKEYLWDDVFARILLFSPKDIDICIISSGIKSEKLFKICKKNSWSYLYTQHDKLSLAQNLAIKNHPQADFIYKIDEDIYITSNYFKGLKDTYFKVKNENKYKIGFVAPLIPVNGYGYRRYLEIFNLLNEYEKKFGPAIYSCMNYPPHINGYFAEWIWDKTFPIDEKARYLSNIDFSYSICYHRFSIGAVLLRRQFWEEINGFKVRFNGDMGIEESHICKYCMENSYAIIVSENVLAGHFAFGPQNKIMYDYYIKNKSKFNIT